MTVEAIAKQIQQSAHSRVRPVLIGIEGFGGSGKTTLSEDLKDALGNAYVIHMDDFIVKEKLEEPAWDTGVFDHARLEKQVLLPASTGKVIAYQKLVYDADQLSEPIKLPAIKYLIVEGISCYHPAIIKYYDYKIWVDTPIHMAKARGQARDGTHGDAAVWAAWAKIDVAYQQKYHSRLLADFVIENS